MTVVPFTPIEVGKASAIGLRRVWAKGHPTRLSRVQP